MNTLAPVLIKRATEVKRIGIVGAIYRFLAIGAETGGRQALIEAVVLPGGALLRASSP